jgi:hypothetical protein
MFSDFKYPITLFIASFIVLIIGLAFKIMHWPGAPLIIGSMLMVQFIAIIWLVIIIVKTKK